MQPSLFLCGHGGANQFFGIGEGVFHFAVGDLAAVNDGACVGVNHLHFAVHFGNQHAQGQLQCQCGVFLHQGRACFGVAVHQNGGWLKAQTRLLGGGGVVDGGENRHAFALNGLAQTGNGGGKIVLAFNGMAHFGVMGLGLRGGVLGVGCGAGGKQQEITQ